MSIDVNYDTLAWRTSSHTDGVQCVEVAPLPGGGVAVRDTKNRAGAVLQFTPGEMGAFIQGAKEGEFDDLIA